MDTSHSASSGRVFSAALLAVCSRCDVTSESLMRALRRRIRRRADPSRITVTVSGCLGSCGSGWTEVALAGNGTASWRWSIDADADIDELADVIVGHLTPGSATIPGNRLRTDLDRR